MKHFLTFIAGVLIVTTGALFAQETKTVFKHQVGSFEICLLSEGQQNNRSDFLIGATPEMLQKYVPDGNIPSAMNAFLVRTPNKIILVDTGLGRNIFDIMQSTGVDAAQVDIVLITHMHGDHIGGMLRDQKVAFPNAEVYLAKQEYDYWMDDEAMNRQPENRRGGFLNARTVITAYKDKLHLFQPNEVGTKSAPLFPGVQAFAAFGHTPGHTAYMVESGKDKFMIWGDLTHAMVIQMPYPQVAVTYDTDPQQAVVSRKKILEFVAKNKIPIAGMHIAFPGMGKITTGSGGSYVFTPFTK